MGVTSFLRSLSPDQQVSLVFVLLFGLLLMASGVSVLLSLRERRRGDTDDRWHERLQDYQALLRSSWVMALVFWSAWAAGDGFAIVLFGFVSFFTLREFISLSPTRRGDHRSLVLASFIWVPLQFALGW